MTAAQAPIKVSCSITIADESGGRLSGTIPLHIVVTDPLGAERRAFYRATRNGSLALEFTLAANDPPGKWAVHANDLLRGMQIADAVTTAEFDYTPPAKCAAIAGATQRAVFAANDIENVFRFARTHHEVTVVAGTSAFNAAAVERLAKILKPWGVACKTMDLAEASKTRVLTEEEAATWCGLGGGRSKAGPGGSTPKDAGFAVRGPVILLGNPEDNAIIKFLNDERFLSYAPAAGTFPGTHRGMVAWQREGAGRNQDSIALIAYDETGINEAVGSFYEAVAGMEPLTQWTVPIAHEIIPARFAHERQLPNNPGWSITLPDRIDALKVDGDKIIAYTHDGSECSFTKGAKLYASKILNAADYDQAVKAATQQPAELKAAVTANARPDRILKLALQAGDFQAFAYWGGDLRVVNKAGAIVAAPHFPNDITALALSGDVIIVGLADGRLMTISGSLTALQPIK